MIAQELETSLPEDESKAREQQRGKRVICSGKWARKATSDSLQLNFSTVGHDFYFTIEKNESVHSLKYRSFSFYCWITGRKTI